MCRFLARFVELSATGTTSFSRAPQTSPKVNYLSASSLPMSIFFFNKSVFLTLSAVSAISSVLTTGTLGAPITSTSAAAQPSCTVLLRPEGSLGYAPPSMDFQFFRFVSSSFPVTLAMSTVPDLPKASQSVLSATPYPAATAFVPTSSTLFTFCPSLHSVLCDIHASSSNLHQPLGHMKLVVLQEPSSTSEPASESTFPRDS